MLKFSRIIESVIHLNAAGASKSAQAFINEGRKPTEKCIHEFILIREIAFLVENVEYLERNYLIILGNVKNIIRVLRKMLYRFLRYML